MTSPGVERIAAHAAVGCITSFVGNGSCGSGALAAGVAKFATGALNGIEHLNDLGRGIAVSIIGGTASVIGGGKFENGAATAAFGYLFNYCAHNGCFDRDFTLADAKANYQSGNGAPITDVGANEINLAGAGYLAKNAPNEFQVNLSPATGSYYIYGTVTGVLDSNGNMSFRSDTYNFDYKDPALGQNTIESGRIVARNAGTFAGRVYNGSGTPYQINFSGSQALPPDTVNRLRNCAPGRAC